MALGEAAGTAAALSIADNVAPRAVDIAKLQAELLKNKAVLIYFQDLKPGDPHYEAIQFWAVRGLVPNGWQAGASKPVDEALAKQWGKLPEKERAKALQNLTRDVPPKYREVIETYYRKLAQSEKP